MENVKSANAFRCFTNGDNSGMQPSGLVQVSAPSAELIHAEQAKPPVLITVSISPESRVKAAAEDLTLELHQGVWKDFLIENRERRRDYSTLGG